MKKVRILALLLCSVTTKISSSVYAAEEKSFIQYEKKEFRKHTTVQLLSERDEEIISAGRQLENHSPANQQLTVQKFVGVHQQVQLTCCGDYKLTMNECPVGQQHNDVVRSGVFLLKDYGHDVPGKLGSRYAVIVGHDANLDFWNFQAGKCEKSHKSTTETASDELYEETGGAVKITARELSSQPYIYSAQKQLFFVRNDQLSVHDIKKACLTARSNLNLSSSQREIDNVSAISLLELLEAAENIRQGVRQNTHTLYSRTEGILLKWKVITCV